MEKGKATLISYFGAIMALSGVSALAFDDKIPNDLVNAREVKPRAGAKKRRNDMCSCGSGVKFKKCCINKI